MSLRSGECAWRHHELACCQLLFMWKITWGQRPGESLILWEGILPSLVAHCSLWNFLDRRFLFFSSLLFFLLIFDVACREWLLHVPYILPHTNNILHFNIFFKAMRILIRDSKIHSKSGVVTWFSDERRESKGGKFFLKNLSPMMSPKALYQLLRTHFLLLLIIS